MILGLAIGLILGVPVGYALRGLCDAARQGDEDAAQALRMLEDDL